MKDVLAQALAQHAPLPQSAPPPTPSTGEETPMDDVSSGPSTSRSTPSTSTTPVSYSFNEKIFIGGLHHNVSEDMLKKYFKKYGKVVDIEIPKNRETGAKRGFGFLRFNVSFKFIITINIKNKKINSTITK